MKITITEDYQDLSSCAALEVMNTVNENPSAVLGLPTGGTPIGMYQQLVQLFNEKKIDFSKVTTFNLDEYIGLSPQHPQSYHYYMNQHFFNHININKANVHLPHGDKEDLNAVCEDYEEKIKATGGIDLLILGVGTNGHIGFNEPGAEVSDKTRVVQLAETTIEANSRFFNDIKKVPKKAITMGLRTILSSKKIILLAAGSEKADIIKCMFEQTPTNENPATFLKLHENVSLILDEQAAQKVKESNFTY